MDDRLPTTEFVALPDVVIEGVVQTLQRKQEAATQVLDYCSACLTGIGYLMNHEQVTIIGLLNAYQPGSLAHFIGAGVSAGCGMPEWARCDRGE